MIRQYYPNGLLSGWFRLLMEHFALQNHSTKQNNTWQSKQGHRLHMSCNLCKRHGTLLVLGPDPLAAAGVESPS